MNNVVIIAVVVLLGVGGVYAITQMDAPAEMAKTTPAVAPAMNEDMAMEEEEAGVMVGGAMMVASLDIVENAAKASNVTTVVAAVSAAGLVETLKSEGPFTVFAPNNAAFAALPAGTVDTLLKIENKQQLTTILTYHVVPGRYTSADLKDGQKLKTVQGEEITIGKVGGNITVNGNATVETADVISSNGVTFVIDAVLMPPAM